MKRYKIKVTEAHVDIVWVDAYTREEADILAIRAAECSFWSNQSCEVLDIEEAREATGDAATERAMDKAEDANAAWIEENYNSREGMI